MALLVLDSDCGWPSSVLFCCPEVIKKYGSAYERHTIEGLTSLPEPRLDAIREEWIRSLYGKDGLRLGWDPSHADYQSRVSTDLTNAGNPIPSVARNIATACAHYHDVVSDKTLRGSQKLDFQRLADAFRIYPAALAGQPSDEGILFELVALQRILSDATIRAEHNDWKVNVLDWRYSHANKSNGGLVLLIGALYLSGSIYFVWRVWDGLLFMLNIYK